MPELPEVETIRRGLAAALTGRRLESVELRRPDLRFPFPERFAERIEGRNVLSLRRRAKYLILDIEGGLSIVAHLGMSGSFRLSQDGAADQIDTRYHAQPRLLKHDHVHFRFSEGRAATYNDPRRFGFMLLHSTDDLAGDARFARLGLEPLDGSLNGKTLARLMSNRKTSLKAALLDQSIISGLGNIYVCEALHRAGLSPERAAWTLSAKSAKAASAADRLSRAIIDVLNDAIAAGGSTLKDFSAADGVMGYFQHTFRVYDRKGAPCATADCVGTIEHIVQAGRSTYFCPACQR